MAWQEELRPASFRGIPFNVLATDGQMGRRAAVHEYPGRDKPWVEDLGRRARVLSLHAVVLGEDWLGKRDKLIAALETAGAGELVHPTLGALQATLIDSRLSESTVEGGMARFDLEFVEAGEPAWPSARQATPDLVAQKSQALRLAAQTEFQAFFKVSDLPDFVGASAAAQTTALADLAREAAGRVQAQQEQLAVLQASVDSVRSSATALVYAPASLGGQAVGVVRQLCAVATLPADALGLARSLWSFGSLEVATGGSATRQAERRNAAHLARLVRSAAVAEAADAAARMDFDSHEQASALRDALCDAADELLLSAQDDAAFDALRALRTAVVADITARGADLSRLARHAPRGTRPALLVAQSLYGDGSRAEDLLARNAATVRHPLFLRAGVELEVLADA
jgi:prophage DNA circulation protein